MEELDTSLRRSAIIRIPSIRRLLAIVVVAVGIRFAVLPFTGHPFDMTVWIQTGESIVQGKSPYLLYNHLGYPPLWGFWTALAYVVSSAISKGNLFVYIFLIKLPIVLADLGVAYFLWRLFVNHYGRNSGSETLAQGKSCILLGSNNLGNKLVAVFLLSPFTIIVGAVWGMMDSLAMLLIMLAVLSFFRKRDSLSGLFFGLAVSLKLYPLILFPVFGVYLLKEKAHRARRLSSFFGTSALTIGITGLLPFPILHWSFSGLEDTLSSQIGRVPGGISPLGWLASLYDLKIYNIGSFSLVNFMNSTVVREAWIGAIALASIWLLTRPQAQNLQTFLTQMMLIMVVWYLSAPWASEPDLLIFLCLLLMIVAINPALSKRYLRVYWIVSGITLAFALFNVPVTAFLWPVVKIVFTGSLYNDIRALILLAIGIIFGVYVGRECVRIIKSLVGTSSQTTFEVSDLRSST